MHPFYVMLPNSVRDVPANTPTLTPHFYIVKLVFIGVYIILRIFAFDIEAVLTCAHNLCSGQNKEKNVKIFQLKIIVLQP